MQAAQWRVASTRFSLLNRVRVTTVVLNWVEYVDKSLDEGRDGPAHMTELDRCDDPDALRKQRRLLAIQAGTAAMQVLLDSSLNADAKGRGIDACSTSTSRTTRATNAAWPTIAVTPRKTRMQTRAARARPLARDPAAARGRG